MEEIQTMQKNYFTYALLIFMVSALMSCVRQPVTVQPEAPPLSSVSSAAGEGMLRIGWRLQSQENVYGFNIYRSETEDGPWKRANAQIIPGHDTTSIPHSYEFFDEGLEIGKRYYYYIEEITFEGQQNRISPIQSAEAKHRDHYKKMQEK